MAKVYRPSRRTESSAVATEPAPCYFGRFCLDKNKGLLSADGKPLMIRPKTLALLLLFVNNPNCMIDYETIAEAVWPSVAVTDESIAQCVRDLRRVLGADAHSPIRTVWRRGYIFTAEVTRPAGSISPDSSEPELKPDRRTTGSSLESAPFGADRPVLVIRDLNYLDSQPEDAVRGQAILEELTTYLASSRDLSVAPYPAHRQNDDGPIEPIWLSRDGARYLLEGTFRRGEDSDRLTLRLTDLALNRYVWGKPYRCERHGMIPVHAELGSALARDVEYAVTAAELRHVIRCDLEQLGAWALYRRGLWHLGNSSRADNDRAGECFRRAIVVDPFLASAYAGLALVHFNEGPVYHSRPVAQSMELAAPRVRHALRLDPDDPETHINAAIVRVGVGRLDEAWEQAERARSTGSDPPWASGVQGIIEQWVGKPREGRAKMLHCLGASPGDPRNALLMGQVVISHYAEGDYEAAVTQALRSLSRYPDCPLPWCKLTPAYGQLGEKELARQALHETAVRVPQTLRQRAKGPDAWMRASDHDHTVEGLEKAGWRRRDWIS
jgi:adenylate cyclase